MYPSRIIVMPVMATILEDVMINIDESLENINLSDYLSRDSNSTNKTNQSTDSTNSTVIQMPIATLKYTQRFYQFEVNKEQINDASQREIEANKCDNVQCFLHRIKW
eukprot:942525_1